MTDVTYPGFSPDNPARRLPWVLALSVLLIIFALMGVGRVMHAVPKPVKSKPKPLQARIYELPASRGTPAGSRSSTQTQASQRHFTSHSPMSRHHAEQPNISIPRITNSTAILRTKPKYSQQSRAATITPPHPRTFDWSTLQSQINSAVQRNDPSIPQVHDPHTMVARYYLASLLEKLQRIGEMNDPTNLIGMPVIKLVIGPHGELQQLTLLRSSGNDRLDNDALQIARESAPFAPFPNRLKHQTQHIEVVCYMKFEGYRQVYPGF